MLIDVMVFIKDFKKIQKKSLNFRNKVPLKHRLLLDVFDKEIRLSLSQIVGVRLYQRMKINWFKKHFYKIHYQFLKFSIHKKKSSESLYININKFQDLEKRIIEYANSNNINIVKEKNSIREIFNVNANYRISNLYSQYQCKDLKTISKYIHEDFETLFTDDHLLSKATKTILKLIDKTEKFLLMNNISKIIATGDSSPQSKILLIAANKFPIII